jgi:hypothetical protein
MGPPSPKRPMTWISFVRDMSLFVRDDRQGDRRYHRHEWSRSDPRLATKTKAKTTESCLPSTTTVKTTSHTAQANEQPDFAAYHCTLTFAFP